ncbi:DNRLRE domain-containing protein [Chryseobacterium suipulveris]|uniref:DNRLRE domain-containing protein n=1 Tax=Chryseobacterium suipulveris TaxID=2929800 RepID=A0ABY4BR33_9FLAO|nr:DNRLRE domain-containing protein [Chryseobacterium suipulveris]UOE41349.1 DNRLRE domain-containing protein [Chryseobacterium suipulveris]
MKKTILFLFVVMFTNFFNAQISRAPICLTSVVISGSASTEDTQVLDSRPNNNFNYSVSNTIYSWTDGYNPASKYVLIKFNVPNLGPISSAKLSLFYNPTDPYESFDTHYGTDNGFVISKITSPWDANTVTWNTKPTVTSIGEIELPAPTSNTQNYTNIDVTPLLSANGFQLRMKNPNYYRGLIFASSTNVNTNLHPRLSVCYSNYGPEDGLGKEIIEIGSLIDDKLNIRVDENLINTHASIISVNNIVVQNFEIKATKQMIDVSQLRSGAYFLYLKPSNSNQIIIKKIIKR